MYETREERKVSTVKRGEGVSGLLFIGSFYRSQKFPLTVGTHSGAAGLGVASHAQEELSDAVVHAPIPFPKTEEETALDWDEQQNQESATHAGAQVNWFMILAEIMVHIY